MKVDQFLARQTRSFWGLAGGGLVILLGVVDYLTGYEFSFSLFYLVPISVVAWYAGRRPALLISAASAIAWFLADYLAGNPVSDLSIYLWNTLMRLCFFLIVTMLIVSLRKAFNLNRELARQDYITGAISVRYFYELAQREIDRSKRSGKPFSLAYLDADKFKEINDTLGHSVGDRVLQVITNCIQKQIRSTDVFARLGGDEFVLLLPETSRDEAKESLSRLYKSVMGEMLKEHWQVTFSIGVVTFVKPPDSVDEMLKVADRSMYTVKNSTRNGVSYALFG